MDKANKLNLSNISIEEIKKLDYNGLEELAYELRCFLIKTVEKNGGHLASNLGVVELSIALHYVFDFRTDKLIFDVGHQCYTHKILTGRYGEMQQLRKDGGASGFPNPFENKDDLFYLGHSSTGLSLGLGQSIARDLLKKDFNVVVVVGDGALTGGMCYEALNQIGENNSKIIIILNDNKMSISKNVGAISKYLAKIRLDKRYNAIKRETKRGLNGIPLGKYVIKLANITKSNIKKFILKDKIFESFGIKYVGPIDGHNTRSLIEALSVIKKETKPILLHVITKKGKGYEKAERCPHEFHNINIGSSKGKKFSDVFSKFLLCHAEKDDKIVAITAAMMQGVGLRDFKNKFNNRCFDVGIAEEHAVTFSASLAKAGLKPYVAIYSTFLQRSYDQILHDVCLNNLPVRFIIDRAGLIGSDGVTHQGIFDLSYLNLPNMTIFAPCDCKELFEMLEFSLSYESPLAIRYPKMCEIDFGLSQFANHWQILKNESEKCAVLAVSPRLLDIASSVRNATVINANIIKPLDKDVLEKLRTYKLIITMEENYINGGFGNAVLNYCNINNYQATILNLGFENFVFDLTIQKPFIRCGMTCENIQKIIDKYED